MMCRIKKAIGLAVAAVGVVFAQNTPQWQNLYPAYNGLAFGDGKFVAVSGDGLIRTTTDGAAWSQTFIRDGGSTRKIYAVAFGAERFVALQDGPSYLHSGDGYGWGVGTTGISSSPWKYIVFGDVNGWNFAAVDGEGFTALFNEADGWLGGIDSRFNALSHAAFGAGRFVVVGDGGIKYSDDARGWRTTSVSSDVSVVAFGGDKFAALLRAGGSAYTSSDGERWESASSASAVPAGMADMAFGNGKFVAVGAKGKGCVSSDGASWSAASGLNEADDFKAVKYGGNAFLALGAKGSVYKSSDGSSWTKLAGNSVTSYKQIVYGSNKFVAVGDSGVSVSSDGKVWERKESAKNLVGVAFGDGKFVAVGSDGTVTYSANGDAWENHSVDDAVLTSIAFGGGVFVAGGRTTGIAEASQAVFYTSANGQTWTDVSNDLTGWNPGQYPLSLCSGGDKFLAAVSGNKTVKTCDATANGVKYWGNAPLPEQADGYNMVSATYVDGKFVVLGTKKTGEGGLALNSADAGNWTTITIPPDIKWVRSATYAKDAYMIAADSGNVYAHMNGAWIPQGRATNRHLSTIYSGNNVILAAGAGGAMLYSEAPPTAISVKHTMAPRSAASKGGVMSLDRSRRSPAVTLSFTPNSAGTVAVYSLSGRQLYKVRLDAGERSVRLPERVMSNGSVIVRYSGGGKIVSQRFQVVR